MGEHEDRRLQAQPGQDHPGLRGDGKKEARYYDAESGLRLVLRPPPLPTSPPLIGT